MITSVPPALALLALAASPALASPRALLPATIAPTELIVVRDATPGATKPSPVLRLGVDGTGRVVSIPVGTRLERVPEPDPDQVPASDGGVPVGELVRWHGAPARIADEYGVTAEDLVSTPAAGYRLVRGHSEWGDVPHVSWFLVDAKGRWLALDDDGPIPTFALSHDGHTLAIGLRALTLVDLRAMKARTVMGYTSPAFGPDGALYVRGGWQYNYPEDDTMKDSVFALDVTSAEPKARLVLAHDGIPPNSEPGMDAGSPEVVTFESAPGSPRVSLVATFVRPDVDHLIVDRVELAH